MTQVEGGETPPREPAKKLVRKYHCIDCYYRELEAAFAYGDPDAFEDGEIEFIESTEKVSNDESNSL